MSDTTTSRVFLVRWRGKRSARAWFVDRAFLTSEEAYRWGNENGHRFAEWAVEEIPLGWPIGHPVQVAESSRCVTVDSPAEE